MADEFTGLIMASDALIEECDAQAMVCEYTLDDLAEWESYLEDPKYDPTEWLRKQRQRRNDCQGQSITSVTEKIFQIVTGSHVQLSDTYAYQGSEYIGGHFGRDQGSSIQSGIKLVTKGISNVVGPGLPTERDWPYDRYTRSVNTFRNNAESVKLERPAILQTYEAPPFRQALAVVVMGGAIHWGTWWSLRWDSKRVVRKYKGQHGNGGHATCVVWAVRDGNEYLLKVLNSHGDGYYFVDETAYEEMRDRRNSPFGAYAVLPDKPVERYLSIAEFKNQLVS